MPMAYRVTFEMKSPSPESHARDRARSRPSARSRRVKAGIPGSRQVRTDVSHFPSRIPVSCQLR